MTAPFYTPPVQYLGKNHVGTDYVIGDIHGRYDLVLKALKKVKFNDKKDRLLCVGDLIDRGMYSEIVAEFLSKDFVYAIRGNHEDMLLELYENTDNPKDEHIALYEQAGISWWFSVEQKKRMEIIVALRQLPLVMEVDTDNGPVGLVHADVPAGMSWLNFVDAINAGEQDSVLEALWGRTRILNARQEGVPGIARVFVGHTVQDKVRNFGNVVAIDTGAVFNEHLTMVELNCLPKTINAVKKPKTDIQIVTNEKAQNPFNAVLDYI